VKLLILTQYFPPEIGAPQNRLFDLALRLHAKGVKVDVLTAMPNYPQMKIYKGYENKSYVSEEIQGLRVHRSFIYVSDKRSVIPRLRNYFSFVYSSMRVSLRLDKSYDFILCESPPLFLGISAIYLCKSKKARLIFNVSDLWPESAEKLNVVNNKVLLKMAYVLEARLYKNAALVTGQTKGICANITERFPEVKTYWLPNGVDLGYYDPRNTNTGNWRAQHHFAEKDFIVLYAGIVGMAQGLELLLEAASILRTHHEIKFVILGSGPEKEKLQAMKEKRKLANVVFLDPVTRKEMPGILKEVNASVVPLRKLELFLGAIPSKIFESLAMQVPVLLGVNGESKTLFHEEGKCVQHFEPEDHNALATGVMRLCQDPAYCKQLGENGRNYVTHFFDREKIASNFYNVLTKL
jgi:glycosyltransferase involved in cell wall biosynthesis